MERKGPYRSEYIRLSNRKAIRIKLWPPSKSKFEDRDIAPAQIEIEEVSIDENGNRTYGNSIRLYASEKAILLAEYLSDFAKEGRRLNQNYRRELHLSEIDVESD